MAELRRVSESDVEAVCAFLGANMHRGMSKDEYRRLFTYRWMNPKPCLGYLLEEKGAIVGFLGAIYSERVVDGKRQLFCNLTNWCVIPGFRNESLRLLFALHSNSRQTMLNLSPTDEVQKMLEAMRYRRLDTFKLFAPPLLHSWTLASRGKLLWREDHLYPHLDEHGRKLVEDHRGTGCRFSGILQDGQLSLIASKKRRKKGLPFTELLHVSSPALLRKHFERVKLGLLLRDRTPLLAVDERLLKSRLPFMLPYRRETFIKAAYTEPYDVDNLYSELAVL